MDRKPDETAGGLAEDQDRNGTRQDEGQDKDHVLALLEGCTVWEIRGDTVGAGFRLVLG